MSLSSKISITSSSVCSKSCVRSSAVVENAELVPGNNDIVIDVENDGGGGDILADLAMGVKSVYDDCDGILVAFRCVLRHSCGFLSEVEKQQEEQQ